MKTKIAQIFPWLVTAACLFWLLGLSFSPWILWAPLGLLFQMVPGASALWFLAHLGFLGWIVGLQIAAVGTALHLSVLRAAFALVMGYGLAAMLYLCTAGLGFLGMVNTLLLWTT